MMQGRTLAQLATELERQSKTKKDFKAPTTMLEAVPVVSADAVQPHAIKLRMEGQGDFSLTNLAHSQLAGWAGIPSKYYDRMQAEAPGLLASNLNHWLHTTKEPRLVRTLDGKARAFLSNRYRTIDNFDIAETALPVLVDNKLGIRIASSEVTENRLYIKAVSERVTFEVKKGDVVQAGIVISNSEVGLGAVKIEPMLLRLVCLNGATMADSAVRKFHIGRQSEDLEKAYEVFRDETRLADDRAFFLKLRDVIAAAFDQIRFREIMSKTQEAANRELPEEANLQGVIELVVSNWKLNQGHKNSIMQHLIKGGDLSQWGLANAVTAAANHQKDYEEATSLERVGGAIIDMTAPAWKELASAAA